MSAEVKGAPPTPVAEGTLERTPLAHVLLHIQRKHMNGTLAVWPEAQGEPPRGQDRILFRNGAPVAARFLEQASSLDRGLLALFHREKAPYAFYEADLVGETWGVTRGSANLLMLLTAACRGGVRDGLSEHYLGTLGTGPIRIKSGVDLGSYGFDAKEQAFVDAIRAEPAPIGALLELAGEERRGKRLLYLLTVTQALESFEPPPAAEASPALSPPSRPPVRSSPPSSAPEAPDRPPPPPSELSAENRLRWEEIARRVEAIEHEDYFTMLGIARSVGETEVRTAFLGLAKKWHPDRLPPELKSLSKWVERIFGYLNRAKDTLVDEKQRGRYLQVVQDGGGTPASDRKVQAIVHAAVLYQKVEVLIRNRQWDEALSKLREASALNTDEPDYPASEAWILFHLHPGDDAPVSKMLTDLNRALKLNERSEKAHFYKGMILKKHGKPEQALHHLRKAVEINPRNIEAAREVRLATMRQKGGPKGATGRTKSNNPPRDEEGFLSKLFGSGKKRD